MNVQALRTVPPVSFKFLRFPPPPCRYLIAKILVKPRALLVYGFAFKAFQNSQSWPYLHSYSTKYFPCEHKNLNKPTIDAVAFPSPNWEK